MIFFTLKKDGLTRKSKPHGTQNLLDHLKYFHSLHLETPFINDLPHFERDHLSKQQSQPSWQIISECICEDDDEHDRVAGVIGG